MNHARRDLGCRSAAEAALPGTSKTKIELCHHARILAFIPMSFDTVSAPVTRPSKWHQRRVVFSRPYCGNFLYEYGKNFRSRVTAHAPTKCHSNSTSGRGARASYRTMLPEISARRSLLEPSVRYLSPGREGEKCRPLDHT